MLKNKMNLKKKPVLTLHAYIVMRKGGYIIDIQSKKNTEDKLTPLLIRVQLYLIKTCMI